MTEMHDSLEELDRVFLEKLLLASDVILRLGEDPGTLANAFEADLWLFRDRIERAMLLPVTDSQARGDAGQAEGSGGGAGIRSE